MSSESGGGRLSNFLATITGCFGRKQRCSIKPVEQDQFVKKKAGIRLPRINVKFPPLKRRIRSNESFIRELKKESLLASGSNTSNGNPVLKICLGFKNEELQYTGSKIYYRSYARTRWDRVLSCKKGVKLMSSYVASCNEPIVDDLPASLWMECLEPTLKILIALNAMKHRRTNLSVKRPGGRPVSSTVRDSGIQHGDLNRDPWINVVGPQLIFQQNLALNPTAEVRPSVMLDFGASPLSVDIDIELKINGRASRKNKHRTILTLPAKDPYLIEEEEPLAYAYPPDSDSDESDDSDDSLMDQSESSDEEDINQSASSNQSDKSSVKVNFSKNPLQRAPDANLNSITKSKLRTWYWYENIGRFGCSDADEGAVESAKVAQKQWISYLNGLTSGTQNPGVADFLSETLKQDSAYRRLFMRDAVLILEDLDILQDQRTRWKRQQKYGQDADKKSVTSTVSDYDDALTVKSISNSSCEQVDAELTPLPGAPAREKQLLSDDYVICDIVPRSHKSGSGTSVESLDVIESDPYESIRKMCKSDKDNPHKAVIVIKDTYRAPVPTSPKKKEQVEKSESVVSKELELSSDLLSVYASRSLEDISEREK